MSRIMLSQLLCGLCEYEISIKNILSFDKYVHIRITMWFFTNKIRNINIESYSYHSPYFNHWRSSVQMNGNSIIDNLSGHSLLLIQAYTRSLHVPLVLTFWLINAYATAQTSIVVFLYDSTPVGSDMLFQ